MSKNNEIWKPILVNNKPTDLPFVVSNKGAYGLKKANGDIEVRIKKIKNGNVRHRLRVGGKEHTLSLAKMIATAFVKKLSAKHSSIIHIDHDYTNNHPSNLKWATSKEHRTHIEKSPNTILARKKKAFTKSVHSRVLNEKSAAELKKMIWDPKRKLSYKQLAEKFDVSEMQIYRIKKGELWFHIKVENEPENERYKQNLKNIAYHEKLKSKEIKETKGKEKNKKMKGIKEIEKKKGKKKKDKKSKKKGLK
ncbi:MAG: hypothetical protein SFY56_05635 [Bacteroidota bacterium]|nr:hypothetical protein [Bacteroidota bacterium]